MAEISACPECQRKLQVPDSFLGQTVQCPECGHQFVANAAPVSTPPAPVAPTPTKVPPGEVDDGRREPRQRKRYDDDDEAFDDLEGRLPTHGNYAPHRGGLILTLGLIAAVGIFSIVPALLGPVAWALGTYDVREINEGRMDPAGYGMTQAGRILGIIATVSFAFMVVVFCLIVAAIMATF